MTPLPKRRHSTRRGGKRERAVLKVKTQSPDKCPKCKSVKLPHRACKKCGFYK